MRLSVQLFDELNNETDEPLLLTAGHHNNLHSRPQSQHPPDSAAPPSLPALKVGDSTAITVRAAGDGGAAGGTGGADGGGGGGGGGGETAADEIAADADLRQNGLRIVAPTFFQKHIELFTSKRLLAALIIYSSIDGIWFWSVPRNTNKEASDCVGLTETLVAFELPLAIILLFLAYRVREVEDGFLITTELKWQGAIALYQSLFIAFTTTTNPEINFSPLANINVVCVGLTLRSRPLALSSCAVALILFFCCWFLRFFVFVMADCNIDASWFGINSQTAAYDQTRGRTAPLGRSAAHQNRCRYTALDRYIRSVIGIQTGSCEFHASFNVGVFR